MRLVGKRPAIAAALAVVTITALVAATVPRGEKPSGEVAALQAADDRDTAPASPPRDRRAELAAARQKAEQSARNDYERRVRPFLQTYCIDCHGADEGVQLVDFERFTPDTHERETWEQVARVLEATAMPPADMEQPTESERRDVLTWIEQTFFEYDCQLIDDPGRVTIRRLNRAEYNATIRDLVGVDFKPADDFPSDDVGHGFDNIGDVLSLPPLLMEKYLRAAEMITEAAIVVGDPSSRTKQRVAGRKLKSTTNGTANGDGFISLASTGAVFSEFELNRPGEYIVRAEAAAQQAGPEPARMEIRVAGRKLQVHDTKGYREPQVYETRLRVGLGEQTLPTGKHRVEAAFINDYYNPQAKNPRERDRNLYVRSLEVQGPLGEVGYPESHLRIVAAVPNGDESVARCLRENLTRFARRAFRRPLSEGEIEPIIQFALQAVDDGESFERGMQLGVQAILVSPNFLFRVEGDPNPHDPDAAHRLSEYELATRLSYFLWSSMPDDELFAEAERGKLHEPQVLESQIRRMLADPKSNALVENFASQWLNLRLLDEAAPNTEKFPTFSQKLKRDMRRETELFFTHIMREDRSILEFLDADYSFLNQRLAEHYGIGDVTGDDFQRVSLAGSQRAGVLTHASILTLTSDPNRTLPVKRGKWIMENILGTAPPDPPANIPALAEVQAQNPDLTLRQQLALHREDPSCASCHVSMDPIGLAFEKFDAVGRWRDKEGEHPIDVSGQLPDGSRFNGALELIGVLKRREQDFARNLTRALLTYALGRGLQYYDKCSIDRISASLAKDDYRFSRLIIEIARSEPFLMRRGEAEGSLEK